MGLAYVNTHVTYEGDLKVWYGQITGDSSYPTGGEALSLASLGMGKVVDVDLRVGGGYVPIWDGSQSAPLVLVFYGNYDSADGPLIQATDGTDLHLVTFNARIAGTQ